MIFVEQYSSRSSSLCDFLPLLSLPPT
jgi:hypothetical protein